MSITIRDGEVETVTAYRKFTDDVSTASSVLIGIGSYSVEPATWVAPDSVSFSTDGWTVTVTVTLGNGHLNSAGRVFPWVKLLVGAEEFKETLFPDAWVFVNTGGTVPPGPFPQFVETISVNQGTPSGPDADGNVDLTVSGGGGGGSVDSVTAGDATVTVGGTASNPTIKVTAGTFDTSGAAAAAQTAAVAAADAYTDGKIAAEVARADAAYATVAQGAEADSAVQPGDLAPVATSGAYSDLDGLPSLGTAAAQDVGVFATAAQGAKADTADQAGFTGADRTRLANTSGTNTGDQDLSALAPKASPALTGTPTAPTASNGTNTTQLATTAFVQNTVTGAVAGLYDLRGSFDASGNVFPSSGGSGSAGAVMKGDVWIISVAGTLGGKAVAAGDQVLALVDAPGQTAGNWSLYEHDLGYTPENTANRGAASGYAPLDGSSKVPIANLPTGATSSTVAVGNDSRLSDSRTPTAHASTHNDGGSDEVALDASQVVSGQFAIARLASGTPDGTKFIADDGTLKTPASGSGSAFWPAKYTLPTGLSYDTTGGRPGVNNGVSIVTGRLWLSAISLPAGFSVGHIAFMSDSTAAATPTHWWFGLYSNTCVQLAVTADQTTTAWAANTLQSLAVATTASGASSSFTLTYDGLYYLGCMVAATTVPNLKGSALNSALGGLSPVMFGQGDTGQTTPPAFPHTSSAPASGNSSVPWAAVGA